jgi:streptogramin lyase
MAWKNRKHFPVLVRALAVLSLAMVAAAISANRLAAQRGTAALTGRVSSQEEGAMEGVLISARKDGSNIATTVVTNAQGMYSFTRDRLTPGHYTLRIRAAGYDLATPDAAVQIGSDAAKKDLSLARTKDLAAQLTNVEWMLSATGTDDEKKALLNCQHCHTMERIFRSKHDAPELRKAMHRMGTYYEGTTPKHPQLLKPMPAQIREYFSAADTEYVSSIILGKTQTTWPYQLKTTPRPKGKATNVIVTEYTLPRAGALPHDALVDPEGAVWYCDHGDAVIGRLDPKTGQVEEFNTPMLKPGFPTGCHFLEIDGNNDLWITLGGQGGVARFDRKTHKFESWRMPKSADNPEPMSYALMVESVKSQGKVWIMESTGRRIQRLDIKSGAWEKPFDLFTDIPKDAPAAARRHFVYDMHSDGKNTVYLWDYYSEFMGKMDFETGKVTLLQTPTFDSGPRRGHIASDGRVWFGEYRGNRIGMLDPRTDQIKEWEMPTPFSGPYDVIVDKKGFAWTGGMTTDRVMRLNITTGEVVEYLMPMPTNIRRVDLQESDGRVAFWTGSNHRGAIVKVEPLD